MGLVLGVLGLSASGQEPLRTGGLLARMWGANGKFPSAKSDKLTQMGVA